ncbi:MAG: hypothetical protein WCT40_02220 [Candidatus Magasanikbacteria bacterium]
MEVVYILLGWLLGILSPGIVSYISNRYKKTALQNIVIEELRDVKKRLVFIPLKVYPAYGELTEKHYLWIKEQTGNFTELVFDDEEKKKLNELLKQNISIENVVKLFNSNKISENPAFHFKKLETSIIDANQNNFDILDKQFITKILEIKFQVRVFNEEVQSASEFLKMTFDSSITEINHQIIKEQIEMKNHTISEKAVLIVEKINQVIKSY